VSPLVTVNAFSSVSNTLPQDFDLWHRLGIHHVGVSSPKLQKMGWARAITALSAEPLHVEFLVHPLYTRLDDAAGWDAEVVTLLKAVQAAHDLGAHTLYFCSPPVGTLRWEDAAAELAARLEPVRALGRRLDVELAVEAVHSSRPEIGFIHNARDAFHLADLIGISVCLDLFVHWNEPGFAALISANLPRLRLVQVSDFVIGGRTQPDRVPPGDGDLQMARVLGDILDAGYDGIIDIELLGPKIEEMGYETALRRSISWLDDTLAAQRLLGRTAPGCSDPQSR
jgi:sugar phosphate isomerase/epimerase